MSNSHPEPTSPADHLSGVAAKELAPVNNTLLLVTSLCTAVLTLLGELLGSSASRYGLYVFALIWAIAIFVIFALIGRGPVAAQEAKNNGQVAPQKGLMHWLSCVSAGIKMSLKQWQYSLLLLGVASIAGTTSYLTFKRSQSPSTATYAETPVQQLVAQGYSLNDMDIWFAMADGNAKAVELARAAGREKFNYIDTRLGNALGGLLLKDPNDASAMLKIAPPESAALKAQFDAIPGYNFSKVFPSVWSDSLYGSFELRVVEALPPTLAPRVKYLVRSEISVMTIKTTALMLAVWSADAHLIQQLIDLGADPTVPTTFRVYPVKTAPRSSKHWASHESFDAYVTLTPGQEAARLGLNVAFASNGEKPLVMLK